MKDTVAALFCHISADLLTPSNFTDPQVTALLKAVKNNCPIILDYFGSALDLNIDLGAETVSATRVSLDTAVFRDWLNPWAAKIGCALWYYHTDKALSPDMRVLVKWITNDAVIRNGIPMGLIDMHRNLSVMQQGSKDFGRQFAYRYEINLDDLLGSFVLLLQNSVAVLISILPASEIGQLRSSVNAGEMFFASEANGVSATVSAPLRWE